MEKHTNEILCCRFNQDGQLLATAGFDPYIFLWEIKQDVSFIQKMAIHKNAATSLSWSNFDSDILFSSSADRSISVFDLNKNERIKKFAGSSIIN